MNKEGFTSVVALHTFMTKMHGAPIYEFLNKYGKSHKPWFRYRCEAMAQEVFGTGRSKGDAKQVVARLMLEQLSLRGYKVPPEFVSPEASELLKDDEGLPTYNFVNLVKALCEQCSLNEIQFEIYGGPPRELNFTAKARIGYVVRVTTGSSKKIAQHLAAEQIYKYLRTKLIGMRPINEPQATPRAQEGAIASTSGANEQRRSNEEPGPSTSRRSARRKGKKNRRVAQVPLAIPVQINQSEQGDFVGGLVGPPPPNPPIRANNTARTMNSFGI